MQSERHTSSIRGFNVNDTELEQGWGVSWGCCPEPTTAAPWEAQEQQVHGGTARWHLPVLPCPPAPPTDKASGAGGSRQRTEELNWEPKAVTAHTVHPAICTWHRSACCMQQESSKVWAVLWGYQRATDTLTSRLPSLRSASHCPPPTHAQAEGPQQPSGSPRWAGAAG